MHQWWGPGRGDEFPLRKQGLLKSPSKRLKWKDEGQGKGQNWRWGSERGEEKMRNYSPWLGVGGEKETNMGPKGKRIWVEPDNRCHHRSWEREVPQSKRMVRESLRREPLWPQGVFSWRNQTVEGKGGQEGQSTGSRAAGELAAALGSNEACLGLGKLGQKGRKVSGEREGGNSGNKSQKLVGKNGM